MNAESQRLLQQLEQATAAENVPLPEMDAETAALRQGWLRLTQLLEAAAADEEQKVILVRPPFSSASCRRKTLAIAALAASALLLVLAGWMSRNYLAPRAAVQQVAQERTLVLSRDPAAQRTSPGLQAGEELAWEDNLGERLANVQLVMESLRLESRGPEMRMELLRNQLQTIENEVETGSL